MGMSMHKYSNKASSKEKHGALASTPPALRIPSDEEILGQLRSSHPVSLRDLCTHFWPGLSWQAICDECFIGTGANRQSLCRFMRDRMRLLLAGSRIRMAPFCTSEPGEAGLSYMLV